MLEKLKDLVNLDMNIFLQRDKIAFIISVVHFISMGTSCTVGAIGSWFLSDARLCFISAYTSSFSVPTISWSIVIFSGIIYKIGFVFCVSVYVKYYYKRRVTYHVPSAYDELKVYLAELRDNGIVPNVTIELPQDPQKRNWKVVDNQIKKALPQIRAQMAELHKNDPAVCELLTGGKFGKKRRRKKKDDVEGPNVLKLAKMMEQREAEYKLLKQRDTMVSQRDDVKIILPEPSARMVD